MHKVTLAVLYNFYLSGRIIHFYIYDIQFCNEEYINLVVAAVQMVDTLYLFTHNASLRAGSGQ